MTDIPHFHHALKIKDDLCIGCSHCMAVCPTEALRIKGGKARLNDNRCVDCGECFKACPVSAIIIEHDDFNKIFEFTYRIALVPAIFIGQFPDGASIRQIYSILMEKGFTHIFEVEQGVEVLIEAMNEKIRSESTIKPLISSFCPAIIRLIQVKFPALVENILLLKPPLDISALYCKKQLMDSGVPESEIGIFYITPCAAKIAAVKSPVGDDTSPITGVINMDLIFNKTYRSLKHSSTDTCQIPLNKPLTGKALRWSLTDGEADNLEGSSLAIDEIHNVIEFLEKIENDEITDVDFLELRACDESCAGGVLTTANRFLAARRLKHRAEEKNLDDDFSEKETDISDYKSYLNQHITIGEVKPRSMMKLDENMSEAMKKMDKANELIKQLPQVDCSVCGTPNCAALAEDIVQGKAKLNQCIFIQKKLEQKGKLPPQKSIDIIKEIWGNNKLENNI